MTTVKPNTTALFLMDAMLIATVGSFLGLHYYSIAATVAFAAILLWMSINAQVILEAQRIPLEQEESIRRNLWGILSTALGKALSFSEKAIPPTIPIAKIHETQLLALIWRLESVQRKAEILAAHLPKSGDSASLLEGMLSRVDDLIFKVKVAIQEQSLWTDGQRASRTEEVRSATRAFWESAAALRRAVAEASCQR